MTTSLSFQIFKALAVGVLTTVLVAGCGGGGGGDASAGVNNGNETSGGNSANSANTGSSGSVDNGGNGAPGSVGVPEPIAQIKFASASFTGRVIEGSLSSMTVNGFPLEIGATVSNAPAGTIYPVITADKQILTGGRFNVPMLSSKVYSGKPSIDPTLAPGAYSGNLTLHLCKDAGCTTEFPASGNTLSYSIVIEAETAISVTLNGVPVAKNPTGSAAFNVSVGDMVSVTSNTAVQWRFYGAVSFRETVRTNTNLSGQVAFYTGDPPVILTLIVEPLLPALSSRVVTMTVVR